MHYDWIKKRMVEALNAKPPQPITTKTLRQDFKTRFLIDVSRFVMTSILRRTLGADYGRCVASKIGFNRDDPEATRLRHEFLHRTVHMIRLEEEGKAVNVWFDESYIHTSHVATNSWSLPEHQYAKPTKGRRLIILHALTKNGWVVTRDADGKPIVLTPHQNADLKRPYLTAEMLFAAKSSQGDYHDNMDSDTYLAWLEFRLFPTLRKLYPGKRFFLWLDNAKYHKARRGHPSVSEKWKGITSMTKPQLAALLELWEVPSITCRRVKGPTASNAVSTATMHTFAKENFTVNAPNGPSLKELQAAANTHAPQHPEFFETLSDKLLQKLSLEDSNGVDPMYHRFNFTPPNEGFCVQATEEAWGDAKGYVAYSPEPRKKNADLIQLTREGLYGVSKTIYVGGTPRDIFHRPVPCGKLVRRCLARCDEWIAEFTGNADFRCCQGSSIHTYECTNNKVDAAVQIANPNTFIINLDSDTDSDAYSSDEDEDDDVNDESQESKTE